MDRNINNERKANFKSCGCGEREYCCVYVQLETGNCVCTFPVRYKNPLGNELYNPIERDYPACKNNRPVSKK